jgi:hypothetical protein
VKVDYPADRFARLALQCIHREYPNKIAHVMNSDRDARPPRELTPAFYGCFDWHSCVHGHWLLVRLLRLVPGGRFARRARAAISRSLTPENVAGEVRYLQEEGREAFERPYGLAWLLQLAAELHEWRDDPDARRWLQALKPLERKSVLMLKAWLPKLGHPIRTGEHSQSAFAFGLVLDWAGTAGDRRMRSLVAARSRAFYLNDRDAPLRYEPSGQDFLSPCIAEADLMRRVLARDEYSRWLDAFLPCIPHDGSAHWLVPGTVTDPSDGKLVHLDGLNLSRAWMLEGIALSLPHRDRRIRSLLAAAGIHRKAGLRAVTGRHYEGGHWLASFAVYLVTRRGLPAGCRAIPPAGTGWTLS